MTTDSNGTKPRKATKAVAKRPATVVRSEPLPAALDRDLRAVPDAAPEPELPEGAVRVPLGDGSVVVPNRLDWPSSATEDYLRGMYTTWASKVLGEDDFTHWMLVDPTVRQCLAFFELLYEQTYGADQAGTKETLKLASRLGIA